VNRLPIIYVRGYAGPSSGIDTQVDDPFYGFNKGATHVRVGGDGDPMFYQFEGPMLRLMIDEQYQLRVRGDQHAYLEDVEDKSLPAASLWVYRFYDQAATTFVPQPHRGVFERVVTTLHRHVAARPAKDDTCLHVRCVAHRLVGRLLQPDRGAAPPRLVLRDEHLALHVVRAVGERVGGRDPVV